MPKLPTMQHVWWQTLLFSGVLLHVLVKSSWASFIHRFRDLSQGREEAPEAHWRATASVKPAPPLIKNWEEEKCSPDVKQLCLRFLCHTSRTHQQKLCSAFHHFVTTHRLSRQSENLFPASWRGETGRSSGSMLMLIFFTVSSGATKSLRLNPSFHAAVMNNEHEQWTRHLMV